MKWLILIVGILTNASASVLIKLAMMPPRKFPSLSDPYAAITNWPLWLGLVLYGAAFLLYALALSKFPLNVAHPILTAGSIATVAIFSWVFFKELFTPSITFGLILIVVGVALISMKI